MTERPIDIRGEAGGSLSLAEFIARLGRERELARPCFWPERVQVIEQLSADLRRGSRSRASAALLHFAFWTRPAALTRLERDWRKGLPTGCAARPLGLVFHLPPQNVETVFLYSWVVSFLLGNVNVVRLPRLMGEEMAELVGRLDALCREAGESGQYFVHYPVADEIGRTISAASDARIVWGGDAKIEAFAGLPLRAGGEPLWFGDRRSFAILRRDAVEALDELGVAALAERLTRDIFPFDQLACASPQTIFLVGEPGESPAMARLLAQVSQLARQHGDMPPLAHRLRKFTHACTMAAEGKAARVAAGFGDPLSYVVADEPEGQAPVGGGFLEIVPVRHLSEIAGWTTELHQTVTHFGFETQELWSLLDRLPFDAVRRFAPVGEALSFDVVWDGYDLTRELCRLTKIA